MILTTQLCLLFACTQFDAALEWYHKATRLHPMYAEAHCNVGVILKERGDLEGAIAAYNRALSAAPNFGIVHGNLAIALTELGTRIKMEGRIAEGITLYERALAHNPKYADALYNLGVAHGEHVEAWQHPFHVHCSAPLLLPCLSTQCKVALKAFHVTALLPCASSPCSKAKWPHTSSWLVSNASSPCFKAKWPHARV
eukprot:1161960-Pelagomonas_calceolata.AAC.12